MGLQKDQWIRGALDCVILVIIGGSWLVLYMVDPHPIQRGIFCDDHTIAYPHKPETVSDELLVVKATFPPLFIVLVYEVIHYWHDVKEKKFMRLFLQVYRYIGVYTLGIFTCALVTDVTKNMAGVPRPHFLDSCQPQLSAYNCSQGYISEVTCTEDDEGTRAGTADLWKSFPSEHSSVAFYIATYFAYYFQIRTKVWFSYALKFGLQIPLYLWAVWLALTRISDNRHHVSDVIAGVLIGFAVAIWLILAMNVELNPKNKRRKRKSGQQDKSEYSKL